MGRLFRRRAHLEGLTAFVDRQQIGDELAGHGQGGAVAMSALHLAGLQRRQLRIPSRGLFGGLDQRGLQPRLRCLEMGPRCCLPAEDFNAAVSPQ